MKDSSKEGIFTTEYCPRGRDDCKSFSNIIATKHESFICCGENNGKTREFEQDKYRICIRTSGSVDTIHDCDKRDLVHQASVIMSALASIEEEDSCAYHEKAVV